MRKNLSNESAKWWLPWPFRSSWSGSCWRNYCWYFGCVLFLFCCFRRWSGRWPRRWPVSIRSIFARDFANKEQARANYQPPHEGGNKWCEEPVSQYITRLILLKFVVEKFLFKSQWHLPCYGINRGWWSSACDPVRCALRDHRWDRGHLYHGPGDLKYTRWDVWNGCNLQHHQEVHGQWHNDMELPFWNRSAQAGPLNDLPLVRRWSSLRRVRWPYFDVKIGRCVQNVNYYCFKRPNCCCDLPSPQSSSWKKKKQTQFDLAVEGFKYQLELLHIPLSKKEEQSNSTMNYRNGALAKAKCDLEGKAIQSNWTHSTHSPQLIYSKEERERDAVARVTLCHVMWWNETIERRRVITLELRCDLWKRANFRLRKNNLTRF